MSNRRNPTLEREISRVIGGDPPAQADPLNAYRNVIIGFLFSSLLALGGYIWQQTSTQIEHINANGSNWSQTHTAVTESELRQINDRLNRIDQKLDQLADHERERR